ncbi:hypothetical protein [Halosegnis sp.]|uniref:hypothetical protein n=1 Tax=Halosegnis sp. TaxID=2864959 RepID=UPI0035D481D1
MRWPDSAAAVRRKPLQAAKLCGIGLAVVLGVAGFFRLIDARGLTDVPLLGDGQFLALVGVPAVAGLLVAVVALETVVAGYRTLTAAPPRWHRLTERPGYVLVRGLEAAAAAGCVLFGAAAVPALGAPDTPAPIGVGLLLGLFVAGLGLLAASFVRAGAELLVFE